MFSESLTSLLCLTVQHRSARLLHNIDRLSSAQHRSARLNSVPQHPILICSSKLSRSTSKVINMINFRPRFSSIIGC
ncbi:hypothetical protein QYF36_004240 [Acer negundo]|nr:hypothetical protein QYF36_004240 [Acer negundo]